MIYLVLAVGAISLMNLGASVYSHMLTEQRLAEERRRGDDFAAALLHIKGEPRAADRITQGERTTNYRKPVPPPAGLKARR